MRDTCTIILDKKYILRQKKSIKIGHRTNQSSLNILYLKNVNMNKYKNNMKRKRNFPLLYTFNLNLITTRFYGLTFSSLFFQSMFKNKTKK